MQKHKENQPKGQVMILFGFAILAILALTAVVIDGGQMYLNRRTAQAAADAAALAGAYNLCNGGTTTSAIATAIQYATTENEGTNATATVDTEGEVRVVVNRVTNSTFARLLGVNDLAVSASAAANCFPPLAIEHVLPVAWACRPPVSGHSSSEDCQIEYLDWYQELLPLKEATDNYPTYDSVWIDPNKRITGDEYELSFPFSFGKDIVSTNVYVIMDSNAINFDMVDNCIQTNPATGTIDCDIDNDGTLDLARASDRSWVSLETGQYGAADMKRWLNGGLNSPLNIHTWLPGINGVKASEFNELIKLVNVGQVVFLPVFDDFCTDYPEAIAECATRVHAQDNMVDDKGGLPYFHVNGFAAFYVTCVEKGSITCPAKTALALGNSVKTIEGYFVEGYPADAVGGTGGVDLGITVRSLTE